VVRHSNAVFITRLFSSGFWVAQGELLRTPFLRNLNFGEYLFHAFGE
jgi:hypothetical protein